jgi:predicted O-methyltransferase YrrM
VRYKNLFKEINDNKSRVILEIGTWDGVHSCQMIEAAKANHDKVVYYGFDVFENISPEIRNKELHVKTVQNSKQVESKLKNTGAEIHLHVGYTSETLPNFQPKEDVDFIYIDGGHSLDTIQNDWDCVKNFMNKDTVVIFDDYYDGDIEKGCYSLIHSLDDSKYHIEILDPEDKFPSLSIRFVKVKLV